MRTCPARRPAAARAPLAALSLALAAFAAYPASPQAVTLRMAAFVPANSPWDLGLKRLAAEFDKISAGSVRLAFPQSVRISDESDVIQKMRLGLDGALLTSRGLADLYPDVMALSMPSLIRNEAEFDAVMARVEPLARARLQDRFEVLAMAKAGWTRYFSRKPVLYPEDIVGMRMAVAPDDDRGIRLFQAVGSRTVKADTPALILQLNTGSIETFYMSPVFVASLWSQFKGKVAYVSPFRMSPFIGAIVVNRASWDKVPAALRPRLREATEAIARQMSAESQRLEDEAMAVLLREGLVQLPYPRDADTRWSALYADRLQSIIAGFFSADMLRTIDEALAKARGGG